MISYGEHFHAQFKDDDKIAYRAPGLDTWHTGRLLQPGGKVMWLFECFELGEQRIARSEGLLCHLFDVEDPVWFAAHPVSNPADVRPGIICMMPSHVQGYYTIGSGSELWWQETAYMLPRRHGETAPPEPWWEGATVATPPDFAPGSQIEYLCGDTWCPAVVFGPHPTIVDGVTVHNVDAMGNPVGGSIVLYPAVPRRLRYVPGQLVTFTPSGNAGCIPTNNDMVVAQVVTPGIYLCRDVHGGTWEVTYAELAPREAPVALTAALETEPAVTTQESWHGVTANTGPVVVDEMADVTPEMYQALLGANDFSTLHELPSIPADVTAQTRWKIGDWVTGHNPDNGRPVYGQVLQFVNDFCYVFEFGPKDSTVWQLQSSKLRLADPPTGTVHDQAQYTTRYAERFTGDWVRIPVCDATGYIYCTGWNSGPLPCVPANDVRRLTQLSIRICDGPHRGHEFQTLLCFQRIPAPHNAELLLHGPKPATIHRPRMRALTL